MQAAYDVIPKLQINSARIRADFDELAFVGATPEGGITRLALSSEDMQARAWFADRIEAAGLKLRDDDAGNLSGILQSNTPKAKTLLIGSHLDSVPNGGRYDGSIGLLSGLECLRTIKEAGMELPVHLEVIDFTDDEGCWMSLFGSRALIGAIPPDAFTDVKQDNGPFRAALARAGIEPRAVPNARRDPDSLVGYIELHIEHGTRLERAGVPIGIVTGIVGRTTYDITFHGEAGHSGTTDMYKRRDALRGAALFIVRTHDVVRERFGDGIFNCGNVCVQPGAFNIVPSEARLTVECRHVSEKLLNDMEMAMIGIARECAASYQLTVDVQTKIHVPAATMAAGVIQSIEQSCESLGVEHMHLYSYSGHGAQILSHHIPSGMIFIPSIGGVGHQPNEFTPWEDVERGANVLLQTILNMATKA